MGVTEFIVLRTWVAYVCTYLGGDISDTYTRKQASKEAQRRRQQQ